MIHLLITIVALVIPVACFSRLILAVFMPSIRARIAKRPWSHAAWFLVSIGCLAILLDPSLLIPKRKPGTFRAPRPDFYWDHSFWHYPEEIAKKDGTIFVCFFERHGPLFFAFQEEALKATRQHALRKLLTRVANLDGGYFVEVKRPRVEALTNRSFNDFDAFKEWWEENQATYVFDENAHLRLQEHIRKRTQSGDPEFQREQRKRREKILEPEREAIRSGRYRIIRPT